MLKLNYELIFYPCLSSKAEIRHSHIHVQCSLQGCILDVFLLEFKKILVVTGIQYFTM